MELIHYRTQLNFLFLLRSGVTGAPKTSICSRISYSIVTYYAVISAGIDDWFDLKPVLKDEEIQGEIHLELSRHSYCDNDYLRIKVLEARCVRTSQSLSS